MRANVASIENGVNLNSPKSPKHALTVESCRLSVKSHAIQSTDTNIVPPEVQLKRRDAGDAFFEGAKKL